MHVFLETERLVLRRFTESDVDNLVELDGDPEVMRYIDEAATPRSEVENDILPRFFWYYENFAYYGFWAAQDRAGRFLGWFHFRPNEGAPDGEVELGYRLRKSAWGKGYATEGSRALIELGFRRAGAERVTANTMFVNSGSRRVMEKCGLRYVRTYHEEHENPLPGTEHGEVEYALTREEWELTSRAGG
ncbi:GNAT family N-acetyltransferase [Allokutzneria albata]|uniref:Protein N-acetyltransferase, RimJ/RimL family n=1 Tax=Allokutzneria albata TaxID=211114 RepID=A0A1G9VTH4_ALLAB|nr:GNAT family N-acetyltransferase [Allokutzneria albata]SDM75316.1 Protein N-acetyltransferase, RimJ/RimL family [Allokutzneria albata]